MKKTKTKKKKVSDILLKNGAALVKHGVIPIERLRKQYRVELFDERACKRCSNRPYRPNDLCDACPALMGRYNFLKEVKTTAGKRYAVPAADLAWLKAACDTEPTIKDRRVLPPLRNTKLKFTGKLFGPNAVDDEGNPRANQKELIKQWKANGCCGTVVAPPRTGKCTSGSTLISTSEGFVEMQELISKKGYRKAAFKTASPFGTKKVSNTYKSRKKTIKVTTHNGFTIEGTPEHPMYVLTSKLQFKWVELKDLAIGDHIVSTRVSGDNFVWPNKNKVSPTKASIMGYFVANGSGTHGARVSTDDTLVQANLLTALDKVGCKSKVTVQKDRTSDISLSKKCVTYLEREGYDTSAKASKKQIPLCVRQSSERVMHAFLSAYFACDSGANGNIVELSTASYKLHRQIHVLLLQAYGILGYSKKLRKYATNSNTPTERTYYSIYLSGSQARKFIETFPDSKVARNFGHRWKSTSVSHQEFKVDYIPYLKEAVRSAFNKARVRPGSNDTRVISEDGTVGSFSQPFDLRNRSKSAGHSSMGRKTFDETDWTDAVYKIAVIDRKLAKKVAFLAEGNYHYERVVALKESSKAKVVYDLTVPDGHAFYANALASHNTVIGAALVCDLRVRTLWIADRFELLDQAYATFMGDEKMGRVAVTNAPGIQERKKKKNAVVHVVKNLKELETTTADVVLINPQKGYLERNMKRFAKAVEGKFGLMIVDEVHGANAARYAQFVSHVDAPMRLGLSATPGRKDGRDKIMQFTVGPVTARTRTTTLLPTIHAAFSKSMPKTNYSSWSPAMAWVAQDKVRNQEIVDLVFKDLKEGHRSIIVPVNYKAHMNLLVDMINKEADKRGMPSDLAVALHAKADRQKILQRANSLKRRTVTVAIMSIVKQGVDVKACSSVIVVIPMSASQGVGAPTFRQLSYRCATPFVGKRPPKVTLLVDNANMLRGCIRGLYWQEVVPRLKGKEISYKIDEHADRLLSKMAIGGRSGGPRNGSWTR